MLMTEYVIWLPDMTTEHRDRVGNKAFNCSSLMQHGFPVPDGFSLTIEFFKRYVRTVGNSGHDLLRLSTWTDATESQRDQWRELLGGRAWTSAEKGLLQNLCVKLSMPLAVRSSGSAEDSSEDAFAGVYTSVLGVQSVDALAEAISECIASAFSDRAISYLQNIPSLRKNVPALSLFVQELVVSDFAGVCFSEEQGFEFATIQAVAGLGERLVNGTITPSSYVVHAGQGMVLSAHEVSQKETLTIVNGEKSLVALENETVRIPEGLLIELSRLAAKAAEHFNGPQDIEWVIRNGKIHFVQSRPLVSSVAGITGSKYVKILGREYGVQYTQIATESLTACGSEWVDSFVPSQTWLPAVPNAFCYMKEIDYWKFQVSVDRMIHSEHAYQFVSGFNAQALFYQNVTNAISEAVSETVGNRCLLDCYDIYQYTSKKYCSFIWLAWLASNHSGARIVHLIESNIADRDLRDEILTYATTPAKLAEASALFPRSAKQCDMTETALRELYEEYLWIPCLDIHNDEWSYKEFVEEVAKHRDVPSEHVDFILSEEATSVCGPELTAAIELNRMLLYIRDARDDFRRRGVWKMRHSLFAEIARRAHEDPERLSYWTEQEIRQFLESGIATTRDDVDMRMNRGFALFLDGDETRCLSGEDAHEYAKRLPIAGVFRNTDGLAYGDIAQTGLVRGRAKIVLGHKDKEKVSKGDIMIAETTHPDFSTAMLMSSGIVTNEGGIASHAAIVCRGHDIPCLVGTIDATTRFSDGDWVELDANVGFIKRLETEDICDANSEYVPSLQGKRAVSIGKDRAIHRQ
jgi:phosphohistidine swiveling domain-containing protein